MKLKEIYKENKLKYPKYVIMIKCGNFYEIYGEEVYIMHNLFNYKIKKIGDMNRVGFPIIAYNKVINKLNKFKINYIIIDNTIIKKKFNKNGYDDYISNLDIENRINKINQRLNLLKESSKIKKVLEGIESII